MSKILSLRWKGKSILQPSNRRYSQPQPLIMPHNLVSPFGQTVSLQSFGNSRHLNSRPVSSKPKTGNSSVKLKNWDMRKAYTKVNFFRKLPSKKKLSINSKRKKHIISKWSNLKTKKISIESKEITRLDSMNCREK